MEGIQWVTERAMKTFGKRYAWNLICEYVCSFSSKAVAYGFGENPGVPKIAVLLKVCFRYICLIRGKTPVVAVTASLLCLLPAACVGCRCKLLGPSVNASWGCVCVSSVSQRDHVIDVHALFSLVLIVPYKIQCMLLSFCGKRQNAIHFGIKHVSAFCFKTLCLPDQFSVIFFCWVSVWDRELENCILMAVLIHNLISVCCYIAKLLPSSVLECDGIRLYWLKFYSHQIRLAIESPD